MYYWKSVKVYIVKYPFIILPSQVWCQDNFQVLFKNRYFIFLFLPSETISDLMSF